MNKIKEAVLNWWKTVKPEMYSHFEWQRLISVNRKEGTFINSLVAIRVRPNTVSEHVDDMIDNKPVVTSKVYEVRVNLWIVVGQVQWVRACKPYVWIPEA